MQTLKLINCLFIIGLCNPSYSQANLVVDQNIISSGNITTDGDIIVGEDIVVDGSVFLNYTSSIRFIDPLNSLASFSISRSLGDSKFTTFGGGFQFFTGLPSNSVARSSFTIAADGNIGIPTLSPQSKLHISNGMDASLTTHGFVLLGSLGGSNLVIDDNEIMARNSGSYSSMFLQKDGGDLLLCSDENGQVGIGVGDPANLPHPDYLLAVDGKIATEDILVEPSNNWPDYVFEESYDLKSIEELEASIQQNGHLPGLPSAEDIEEDGQHLGEIQLLLLEKIEELSLYIIQQNKMLLEQQKELEELRVKIEHSHK